MSSEQMNTQIAIIITAAQRQIALHAFKQTHSKSVSGPCFGTLLNSGKDMFCRVRGRATLLQFR